MRRVPLVRPVSPATDVRALRAIRDVLGERRPAIVHTHMAKAGALGRIAALSIRPRPRLIHTFHGHVLDGYFSPPTQRAFVETERWLAGRTDRIVVTSEENRDELLALGIGTPAQLVLIPIGLDLGPFLAVDGPDGRLRAHLGLSRGTPLVGACGRLVPIKGLDTMVEAIKLLPGTHLALIGDGELRPRLETLARELGVADRVHITGWWDDIPGAVSDLDVVALTSHNEGTPLALIEAGAAARPVVATNVGGVRAVVEDGVTGWLTGPGDPPATAAALRRLLEDPAARTRMGRAGRERVGSRFGQDRLIADIHSLYADLLS